jgi:hypothetical protein
MENAKLKKIVEWSRGLGVATEAGAGKRIQEIVPGSPQSDPSFFRE